MNVITSFYEKLLDTTFFVLPGIDFKLGEKLVDENGESHVIARFALSSAITAQGRTMLGIAGKVNCKKLTKV